jgi:quinol monooxygenase YgiN
MSTPVKIVAILTAKPGMAAELEKLLFGMAPHCRAEPGNLRWDIWQDRTETGRFVLDELYKDDAGVAAHRETPHFRNYLAKINDLADRVAVVVHPAQVA